MLALSKRQRKHATRQKSNLLGGMLVRPLFGANKHVSLLNRNMLYRVFQQAHHAGMIMKAKVRNFSG